MTKSSLVVENKLTAPDSWLVRVTTTRNRFGMVNCVMAQKGNCCQEHEIECDLLGRGQ